MAIVYVDFCCLSFGVLFYQVFGIGGVGVDLGSTFFAGKEAIFEYVEVHLLFVVQGSGHVSIAVVEQGLKVNVVV